MPRTLIVTNDFPPRQGGIEAFVSAVAARFPASEEKPMPQPRKPETSRPQRAQEVAHQPTHRPAARHLRLVH